MFNIVLFEPEIPPNTGNIIRLAANSGATLHLIEPLGFDLEAKKLRRAGLDYRELAGIFTYENWDSFLTSTRERVKNPRIFGLSTKGQKNHDAVRYQAGDFLLFGPESRGLPDWLRSQLGEEQLLRIPMRAGSRSLNLSNAAAIVVYEAWRQLGFPDGA